MFGNMAALKALKGSMFRNMTVLKVLKGSVFGNMAVLKHLKGSVFPNIGFSGLSGKGMFVGRNAFLTSEGLEMPGEELLLPAL